MVRPWTSRPLGRRSSARPISILTVPELSEMAPPSPPSRKTKLVSGERVGIEAGIASGPLFATTRYSTIKSRSIREIEKTEAGRRVDDLGARCQCRMVAAELIEQGDALVERMRSD